ncbi:MAG: metal/formaldehyde-sensitive transcriptional repressor [Sphingomonadaceae bacterium]|nr:metal/formaldehyde-sensitive transcriptional repressor [Sphingomonadaceae bacterium]MBJ7525823.1 metal/formaldehyde-sensitive transcriptional repressor [Sphingomonadaceae bacterium]
MKSSNGNEKIIARIQRIADQVAAIQRSVSAEAPCADTLRIVSAVRGAISALMDELIQEHLRSQAAAPDLSDEDRQKAAEELATVIRRYVR